MKTAPKGYIEIEKYEKLEADFLYQKEELAQLKRLIFGKSNERFTPSNPDAIQLQFDFGDLPELVEVEPAKETEIRIEKRKKPAKKKPVRENLPPHLRREKEVIEPENIPENAVKIGDKITEILEYQPGEIYVRQIVRPKYALPNQAGIINAEIPSLPLPKSNAGASLLAHLLIAKFVDHLPFHRIIKMFKRENIKLAESTVNNWYKNTCNLLEPLYNAMKTRLLVSYYLQADETPIPVLTSDKKGATHKGYYWVYYDPIHKLVIFDYQKSRGREGPDNFLGNFSGSLQTDGYSAYDHFEKIPHITLLGCMTHARRYFEKSLDSYRELAEFAMLKFAELYRIERAAKDNNLTISQIKEMRQKESLPILNQLKVWLIKNKDLVLPKSSIGKAIQYTINQWPKLIRYIEDGKYQIDNNLIENQIRPIALGRKNYLFAGSHESAQRAAMIYSLLGTCKQHNVNPREWLTYVLTVLPEHKANKLSELFPQNFAKISN